MDVATSLRRQKSGHAQPPVNICGSVDGYRIEVFGETLTIERDFAIACETYEVARLTSWLAVGLLDKTLSRRVA